MANFLDKIMGLDDRPNAPKPPPIGLTIAGSDSGGGAGLQADIKTFAALRIHATSVVTLVTAQNTKGVTAMEVLPGSIVRAQLKALHADLPAAATKMGALGNEAMILTIFEWLQDHPIDNLVIDPVMVSKHGDPLMPESAQCALRDRLLEHALLITPNCFEAEAMTGRGVGDLQSMREAAKRLFDHGPTYVLIKGSHLERIVRDIVYDGHDFIEFGADRIRTTRLHGSGCTFSAAITARLAHGDSVLAAVEFAREFITKAIDRAPALGSGISPVNPMYEFW